MLLADKKRVGGIQLNIVWNGLLLERDIELGYQLLEEDWLEVIRSGSRADSSEVYIVKNVDTCIEKIMNFVDEENKKIETLNGVNEKYDVNIYFDKLRKGTNVWNTVKNIKCML